MRTLSIELDIGENYTRGEISDLMHYSWRESINEIYCGIYKPSSYSSVLLFSTINNPFGYKNWPESDDLYIFSGRHIDTYTGNTDDCLTKHKLFNYELLLFIRQSSETGFFYYGKSEFVKQVTIRKYYHPIYVIRLLETKFSSQAKNLNLIPLTILKFKGLLS